MVHKRAYFSIQAHPMSRLTGATRRQRAYSLYTQMMKETNLEGAAAYFPVLRGTNGDQHQRRSAVCRAAPYISNFIHDKSRDMLPFSNPFLARIYGLSNLLISRLLIVFLTYFS